MDAFAVTISNMFVYRNLSRTRMMLMPITFGFFQGIMPLIGYFAGTFFADMMSRYAGIISFLILGFIGGKMIWDALHEEPETNTLEKTKRALLLGKRFGILLGERAALVGGVVLILIGLKALLS